MAEKARRERMRIVDRGFTSFDLSEDGRRVLLPAVGQALRLRAGRAGKVRRAGRRRCAGASIPRFSPDGTPGGLRARPRSVRGRRRPRGTERAADPGRHRRADPRRWPSSSPRRRWGASRATSGRPTAQAAGLHRGRPAGGSSASPSPTPPTPSSRPTMFPYPRPGQANAKVRLGIIAAARRRAPTWVRWDAEQLPLPGPGAVEGEEGAADPAGADPRPARAGAAGGRPAQRRHPPAAASRRTRPGSSWTTTCRAGCPTAAAS